MLKPISNPDIGVVYPNSPLVCWYVGVHHFILWSYGHKGLEYDLCTLTLELSIHNKLISYVCSILMCCFFELVLKSYLTSSLVLVHFN
jgi:hypothetical protein